MSEGWTSFATSPTIVGIATATATATLGYLYNLHVKREERKDRAVGFEVEYMKNQLQGWVNYSASQAGTIASQSQQIAALETRMSEKDRRIDELEKEVTDLWRRIRGLEAATRQANQSPPASY